MRFMLAYLTASLKSPTYLHGSGRQHKRPIAPLVDALRALGSNITYTEQEGYPPLLIEPAQLRATAIEVDASDSSQYLSALLLIAPLIKGEGYSIQLSGEYLASAPYAQMTISTMREAGHYWQQIGNTYRYISSSPGRMICALTAEADWTAASYAYLLQTLHPVPNAGHIALKGLRTASLQGDSQVLPKVFAHLGVSTHVGRNYITLSGHELVSSPETTLSLDCNDSPDLVPTLVAACIARGQSFELRGIGHLRHKESNRIEALTSECAKIGVKLTQTTDTLSWNGEKSASDSSEPLTLCSHGDHRMVMALAPLFVAMRDVVAIDDTSVVSKSFPTYWSELGKLGYIVEHI